MTFAHRNCAIAITIAISLLAGCGREGTIPADATLAIRNVTIVDVDAGALREHQTVLIGNGRILATSARGDFKAKNGLKVVDGDGKYLIPGLWDMHAHVSTDPITRATVMPLMIANGVTGVRIMSGDCVDGEAACPEHMTMSAPQIQKMRADIADGALLGPMIVAASHLIDGPAPGEPSTVTQPSTAEDGRRLAHYLKERGVDFAKPYDLLSRDAYFALVDEANKIGLPVAGHVPVAVRASEASDAGQKSIEHCCAGNLLENCSAEEETLRPEILQHLIANDADVSPLVNRLVETHDAAKCKTVIEKLVQNGTWFTPTLIVGVSPGSDRANVRSSPFMKYLPPAERSFQEALQDEEEELWGGDLEKLAAYHRLNHDLTARMNKAGVGLLAGCDSGGYALFWGFCLHEELQALVGAGLTPAEALRAATLSPAIFFGREDELGSVEEGKIANLVLLNADPLTDIANTTDIAAVVLNGAYLDRGALDDVLTGVESFANAQSEPEASE